MSEQIFAKIDKNDNVVKVLFETSLVPQWNGDLTIDPAFHIIPVPSEMNTMEVFKWKYENGAFLEIPEIDEIDRISEQVRVQRNNALSMSDWTQLPDSPFSEITKQAWATYRQNLRDITTQPTFPTVIWPIKPV